MFAGFAALFAAQVQSAHAAHLQVLYNFCTVHGDFCNDGAVPLGSLVRDASGNLYGTTSAGGPHNQGTVFEITNGSRKTLYNFCRRANCTDGANPQSALVIDSAGNLFGTAQHGGKNGDGVAFELSKSGTTWTETVIHNFCNKAQCADGGNMVGGLTMDSKGNLFGTTEAGGLGSASIANGTVFELTKNSNGTWTEHVLYAFCSRSACTDGTGPQATIVFDSAGNIYGTTENGGKHGSGVVFRLAHNAKTNTWNEKVLYHFCSVRSAANPCKDGATPLAPLAIDASGNLFGTTMQGGSGDPGFGTVFELVRDQATGAYTFKTLHTFCKKNPTTCSDGALPFGGVVLDGSGFLYGTTSSAVTNPDFDAAGTVFRLSPTGAETKLQLFCGTRCDDAINNGSSPKAGLLRDAAGNLYGTTSAGGLHNGGEVFEIVK